MSDSNVRSTRQNLIEVIFLLFVATAAHRVFSISSIIRVLEDVMASHQKIKEKKSDPKEIEHKPHLSCASFINV